MHARSLALQSIAFAALCSFAACGVQTDQGAAGLPETGTAAAAIDARGDEETLSSLPVKAPDDPAKWMEEHLPRWKVYFAGSPYDAKHGLYTWPTEIDHNAPLLAVKEHSRSRFPLSAVRLRDVGSERHHLWLGGGSFRGRLQRRYWRRLQCGSHRHHRDWHLRRSGSRHVSLQAQ